MSPSSEATAPTRLFVATLPGWPDARILRAAARAGATAVLNLEGVDHATVVLGAVVTGAQGNFAVRVDSASAWQDLQGWSFDRLQAVVLTADAMTAIAGVPEVLRAAGCQVILECTTVEDALLGVSAGVDGLIVKGHESGGRIGEETTFVLVQRVRGAVSLPIYAQGGIGPRTAAACLVAGCEGVVLDSQLLLTRESSLDDAVKSLISRMAGDETLCLGSEIAQYRVYRRPGLTALAELDALAHELSAVDADPTDVRNRWRSAIRERINWRVGPSSLWPLGQDAALAAELAQRHRSVAGVLAAIRAEALDHLQAARELTPLAPGGPLAVSHGTAVPILQGPMTRVSDTVGFAVAVADGGALPFLALALLRGPQVRTLLKQTQEQLAGRPWGVGILGFVPLELREEQLAVIEEFRPPFALIAGGRPDQAAKLERLGITTFLHVPAPSLLKMFLDDGARRFIFEGRECGGHVGPRTSFVLWELMVSMLLDAIGKGVPPAELHIVFAGGIHDALSAAMVSAIAAPLARAGVRVGALMGTAYLFTEEAVTSGAIVETFQKEALACSTTVLLETGPGHSTRCADTAFCDTFRQTRRELVATGRTGDDLRLDLESLNLGRLRVASKGIRRASEGQPGSSHVDVDVEAQRQDGMYMIGQVAALRGSVCRIADLHRDVSEGSAALLAQMPVTAARTPVPSTAASLRADVAIIGMGCLLPDAPDVSTLWHNVLTRHDAIREIPKDRFDADLYYDADRKKPDKIYSRWGGFLDEVAVDPLKHGIPPSAMPSIDPFQLLTLEVVDQALKDAGYGDRPFNRERTSVILGASGGVGDLGFRYGIRAGLPMVLDDVSPEVLERLPVWTEDSFAGVLLNVAAGRVANRLDLGGLNLTVDAACASSLAAVYMAARELESGSSDMVLVGGIDTVNSPFGYLCFSSAQALSPRGRCSTFDEQADGIAISEGLTVLVLKRLEDAERDGDRIYSVIRAVAGSSDGRGKGLTAPRPEGQMRVLERAYAAAGISPATVGLIEAHGTGTVAGDGAEVSALSRVFGRESATPQSCAIGSIKSMIGHTKSAAGVTGLLKVALALHHKVLPPTLHVTRPNARLQAADTPFYVNTDARPWLAPAADSPRRAGVSSFGFGGTNFHVVMEEYDGQARGVLPERAVVDEWPSELFVWTAPTVADLVAAVQRLERQLGELAGIPLRTIAANVGRVATEQGRAGHARLAIVADSVADLRAKMTVAVQAIESDLPPASGKDSIFLSRPGAEPGAVAFLFPGQGSQYPGMHRDLAMHFADVRHALELADACTVGQFDKRLSSYILPPATFTPEERDARMGELTDTAVAQPALGAVEMGLVALLARVGVRPDLTAGHSYGEYVALWASGAFPAETLMALSVARGQYMKDASADNAGTMAAVVAPPERITEVVGDRAQVWIANINSPRQTVIAGSSADIEAASQLLGSAGIATRRLAVSCAFHSPLVGAAQARMAELLAGTTVTAPRLPVYANAMAAPYPAGLDAMRDVLSEHLVSPVRFSEQIAAMYEAGARTFIEVGPKGVLSSLVRETLAGRDAVVVSLNARDTPELTHLLRTLGQLVVAGLPVALSALWQGRSIPTLRLDDLRKAVPAAPPAHAWMVSGGRVRPLTPRKPAVVPAPERPPATVAIPNRSRESREEKPARAVVAATTHSTNGHHTAQVTSPADARPMAVATTRVAPRQTPYPSGGGHMHQNPMTGIDGSIDQTEIVRQFQQIMGQFLQTQALVMTAYLQGSPMSAAAPALTAAPPRTRPELRSAPEVQQARLGALSVAPPPAPPAPAPAAVAAPVPVPVPAPTPVAPPAPVPFTPAPAAVAEHSRPVEVPAGIVRLDEAKVLRELLRIVSDRTGYPEEMLTVDANIEADLGIDSIKRMEILGAFHETHVGGQRGAFQDALERLTALKTLRETAAALTEFLADEPTAVAV